MAEPAAIPAFFRRPTAQWVGPGLALFSPLLIPDAILSGFLIPVLILGIAALGVRLLTADAGQLSLGSTAFMAVGAFASWNLVHRVSGMPVLVAVVLGGICAAVVGLLFVLPSLRIKGFYAVLATFAAQFFITWLFARVGWFSDYSPSGSVPTQGFSLLGLPLDSPTLHAVVVLVFVMALKWVAGNLAQGQIGRIWRAKRDDVATAERIGLPPVSLRMTAFAASCFYCGVAGALAAYCHLGFVQGAWFSLDLSFRILFMVILGGAASPAGPFLGAAFVVALPGMLSFALQAPLALLGVDLTTDLIAHLERMLLGAATVYVLARRSRGLVRAWEVLCEILQMAKDSLIGARRVKKRSDPA